VHATIDHLGAMAMPALGTADAFAVVTNGLLAH
jgi:hypothetical protein